MIPVSNSQFMGFLRLYNKRRAEAGPAVAGNLLTWFKARYVLTNEQKLKL